MNFEAPNHFNVGIADKVPITKVINCSGSDTIMFLFALQFEHHMVCAPVSKADIGIFAILQYRRRQVRIYANKNGSRGPQHELIEALFQFS